MTPSMKFRLPRFLMTLLSLLATPFGAGAQDGTTIEMKAIAGLRFDPPRFQVAPGAKVKLVLENADDMAHNLVIVAPGARPEIVNAAMTMPITPTADFIPKSEKVLWAVPVLVPGKSATLEFTAPAAEGVYPFVCTYPGHGLVMFGAMYVGAKAMPAIARDTNLPDMVREAGEAKRLHAFAPQPPYLYRTFMRDSGPASIAVALPGGKTTAGTRGRAGCVTRGAAVSWTRCRTGRAMAMRSAR